MPSRSMNRLIVASDNTPRRTFGNRLPSRANGFACSMTFKASCESGTRKSASLPRLLFIYWPGTIQVSPSIWSRLANRMGLERSMRPHLALQVLSRRCLNDHRISPPRASAIHDGFSVLFILLPALRNHPAALGERTCRNSIQSSSRPFGRNENRIMRKRNRTGETISLCRPDISNR